MDVANILLRITGDSDDARRELAATAAAIAGIDGQEAEAEVDVETTGARAKLRAFRVELARLAREKVTVEVGVDIDEKGARTGLLALMSRLGGGGGGDGFLDKKISLGPFSGALKLMIPLIGAAITAVVSLGGALAALAGSAAFAIGGLVAILGELVSSLGAAAAGAGALGISLTSLLIPAVALGVGAFQRFQKQAEETGTAAHQLKRIAGDAGQAFRRMIAPGADAVLRGMAEGLKSMIPVISSLTEEFTTFGESVGRAFSRLGEEFSSSRWRQFFAFLTNSASQAVGPLTTAFIGLSRVLRNIAQAAMPFLQNGLRSLAVFMTDLAHSTSNIGALRDSIGGLVDHLRSWWELATQVGRVMLAFMSALAPAGKDVVDSLTRGAQELANWARSAEGVNQIRSSVEMMVSHLRDWAELAGQVGRIMLNFFTAAAPAGREMVNWLTEGAEKLADFLGSTEGKNAVRDYFAATMPLVKELIGVIGQLAETMVRWSQLTAPVLTPLIDILGKILDLINRVLEALAKLPGPLNEIAGAIALFGGGKLAGGAFSLLGKGLKSIPTAARGAVSGIGKLFSSTAKLPGVASKAASGFGSFAKGVANTGINVGKKLLPAVARLGPAVFSTGAAFSDLEDEQQKLDNNRVAYFMGRAADSARKAQTGVEIFASGVTTAVARATGGFKNLNVGVGNAMKSVGRTISVAFGGIQPQMASLGRNMTRSLANGISGVGEAVSHAARSVAGDAADGARSLGGAFKNVGKTLGGALAVGQRSARGAVVGAARGVGQAGRTVLEGLRGAYQGAGRGQGNAVAQGVNSARGAVGAAARGISEAGRSVLDGAASSFTGAGRAMGESLAAGIRSAIGSVVSAGQAIAQAARDVMPGSEPKDPTSPLRNLGAAGAAIVGNLVAGVNRAGASLPNALAAQLAPVRTALPAQIAAGTSGTTTHQTQNFNLSSPAAQGMPDPKVVAAQLGMLMRLQGMRA